MLLQMWTMKRTGALDYSTHSEVLLVADTGVVFNLIATKCSEAILDALPNHVVVSEELQREILRGKEVGHSTSDGLEEFFQLDMSAWSDLVRLAGSGSGSS